jgi:hypothetical protein
MFLQHNTQQSSQPALPNRTFSGRCSWNPGTGAKAWANESFVITTAETVRYCVRTEIGCWYEVDNEVLDLDEAKKVVTVDEAYLDTHLPQTWPRPPLRPCGVKPTVLTAHSRHHYTRTHACSGIPSVSERRSPCVPNRLQAGRGDASWAG